MAVAASTGALMRDRWANLPVVLLLASPTAVLLLLLRNPALDPHLPAPVFHFQIVTTIAAIGGCLAVLMVVVAERLQEPRGFFLALAFGSIAGFFFIHGFLTPGVFIQQVSHGIHWAPLVGFALAGICLLLSTSRPQPYGEPWMHRYRHRVSVAVFVVWAGFLTLSLTAPNFLPGHTATAATIINQWREPESHAVHTTGEDFASELLAQLRSSNDDRDRAGQMAEQVGVYGELHGQPWIAGILTLVASILMGRSIFHYARQYRLSQLPSHLTVVWGIALLLQSLLAFFFASVWRVSWWEYHVLALMGVSTIVYGLAIDYRRGPGIEKALASLIARGSVETLEESYTEVLTGLVAAMEARDPYTKGHSEKVARLAANIGERLALAPENVRGLYHAGLLHDVGKMAIPDVILRKEAALTDEEFELVKGHPARSEDIVARVPSLRPLRWAVRWHHERLDGSGYPDALKGEQIPMTARILAVADVYDAMTSGRAYRLAIPPEDVLAWMVARAGLLFDAECLETLHRVVRSDLEKLHPVARTNPKEGRVE